MNYSEMNHPECSICSCEDSETNFITLNICSHSFCKACFTEYINTEISNFNILKIKCPEQTCSHVVTSDTLKTSLDSQTFEKYETLRQKKLSNQSQNDFICPQPGCSRLFQPLENTSHTSCQCGALICNSCGLLNHEGKSCVAAIDPEFEAYAVKNDVKICVMCKTIVSKIEGCTHITCPICDYEWCWLCGREHNQTHQRICARKWDPLPPAIIVKETMKKDTRPRLQRLFIWVKDFLKVLIITELFWPYLLFNVPAELRSEENSRREKIQVFILAFIVHMIYLCPIIFLMIKMIMTPEFIPVISACMSLLALMPWFIKLSDLLCCDRSVNEPQKPKRWQLRNAENFRFNPIDKPPVEDDATVYEIERYYTFEVEDFTVEKRQMQFDTSSILNIQRSQSENLITEYGATGILMYTLEVKIPY